MAVSSLDCNVLRAAVFLTSVSSGEGCSEHSFASGVVQSFGQQEGLQIWIRFLKIVHKRNSACCCIVDADFI
jgi:hypothetical protein